MFARWCTLKNLRASFLLDKGVEGPVLANCLECFPTELSYMSTCALQSFWVLEVVQCFPDLVGSHTGLCFYLFTNGNKCILVSINSYILRRNTNM